MNTLYYLSTGRYIIVEDGNALPEDGGIMTQAEWDELCASKVRYDIQKAVDSASEALQAFPKSANGLTPDDVKRSIAFKAASLKYERAHAALRKFNTDHKPPRISTEKRMLARKRGAIF